MNIEIIYEKLEHIEIIKYLSSYEYSRSIEALLKDSVTNFKINGDNENFILCQIEIDILNFSTIKNNISYTYSTSDSDGNQKVYPDFSLLQDRDFEYIDRRLKCTNNDLLIARYSHILWHSPKRHLDYAKIAARSYLNIAELIDSHIDVTDSKNLGQHLVYTLENAILISSILIDKEIFNRAKFFIMDKAKDFSFTSNLSLNIELLRLMLKNKRLFKKIDFIDLDNNIYEIAKNAGSITKLTLLEVGKEISLKLGNKNINWDNEIAKFYEAMSYEREADSIFIAIQFVQDAIKHYKIAKENGKVMELTKRYNVLKESQKLVSISKKIDITDIMELVKNSSDTISSMDISSIIQILMYDKTIIPTYEELKNQALKEFQVNPIELFVSTSCLDDNGHISGYFNTEEEHIHFSMLKNFTDFLQYGKGYLLNELFFKSVMKGTITPTRFLEFMRSKTWIGQDIVRVYKNDVEEKYNWLSLIFPAINDYLVQLHFFILNQSNGLNLILCIDSLTLKIEGIIRDLLYLIGGDSYYFINESDGINIAREKDINALLHEELIEKYLSQDDLFFLKYLLIENSGLNLRNRVAHSFFRHYQNYSIEYMNLLILAILRLSKSEYNPFVKHSC